MRRYLYFYLVLAVVEPALFGQVSAQTQDRQSQTWQLQPSSQPSLGRQQESDAQVPAAQYSPLAAQGGYSHARTSPLDAMVHALNPRDVNLGAMWEARRRA